MKRCWIVFEDDLHLNSNKVSKVFLNKDKAENYLQNKIDTQPEDDMLVWTILESELDEELDNDPLIDDWEYVPELNDRVKFTDLAYRYINYVNKGDCVIGTITKTRINTSGEPCCEMYAEVLWNNGFKDIYPMSFLKKI